MGKIKITNKDFRNFNDVTFSCGYCDLQRIAYTESPRFYNCGVYGWNWDGYVFYIDGISVGITTGYRNTTGKTVPYELIKEYSEKAQAIIDGHTFREYDEMKKELHENLDNFLRAALATI